MNSISQDARRPDTISEESDIVVGGPLPRETIQRVERGYLANCSSYHCQWEGLFPSRELAADAVNAHLFRQRVQQDAYHLGSHSATITELDGNRARQVCASHHVYIGAVGPRTPLGFEEDFGRWYPRATEDLRELVNRGDRILFTGKRNNREGKVATITETRTFGIPTWSVSYAPPETDLTRKDWQAGYLNELIAFDGEIYRCYGGEFLGEPVFEVIGQTEHQAVLGGY